ncbi:prolyl oligopeptidase family serine peptidase [Sunxiuqinia sp. A32]|uniref:carboxylesterase family protein n=1 Tax=Sunxiuqinia sp. A32 TaxID=3461496 RepID=UPI00404535AE
MKHLNRFYYLIALMLVVNLAFSQNPLVPNYEETPKRSWEDKFDSFSFKVFKQDGHTLPYRLYVPENLEKGKDYPLVIFFHGAGEKGFDNRSQFQRFNPVEFWKKFPCYVLAPECPSRTPETTNAESVWVDTPYGNREHQMKEDPTWPMQLAISLIQTTINEKQVDTNRVYVTGLSMGGFATWEILQRHGEWFAAAIPVCGGGDLDYAAKLKDIPMWVFHGAVDQTVPVECSRDMVAAIQKAGGKPGFTEFPDVDHGAWTPTYGDPQVWEWLFKQVKK